MQTPDNRRMDWKRIVVPLGALVLVAAAWRAGQWQGVLLVVTVAVFWLLLHVSRLMTVMKRASGRPIGHVSSAVMLNAKLHAGQSLLHVIALTKSLGKLESEKNQQPEVYRWADNGESWVVCTFSQGKLVSWTFGRPEVDGEADHAADHAGVGGAAGASVASSPAGAAPGAPSDAA